MTRFRTSVHTLDIDVGRYKRPNMPVSERLYKLCTEGEIENEYHIFNVEHMRR